MTLAELRKIMARASFAGQPVEEDFIETHISWLFFTREYALKLKRPVKMPFLDFSTSAQRWHFCFQETQLNRRLTDIYLGVAAVNLKKRDWHISSPQLELAQCSSDMLRNGEPIVIMKRLPESRRMDHLVENQNISGEEIRKLSALIAGFHQSAQPQSGETLKKIWQQHWLELGGLLARARKNKVLSSLVNEIRLPKWKEVLINIWPLLEKRAHQSMIRDVHGDLHCKNIFITPEPVIFDCIEFNPHYRYIDIAEEVAMLYADLLRLEAPALALEFIEAYQSAYPQANINQEDPLFVYYCTYRLSVRVKVLLIKYLDSYKSLNSAVSDKNELESEMKFLKIFLAKLTDRLAR